MNKKFLFLGLIVILLLGGAAVAVLLLFRYQPNQPPQVVDTGSTPQGIQEVVKANNQFAWDLYAKLAQSDTGNIFYSPYSISAALAMAYEGARGQTAEEIRSVFHFPESNVLRPNLAAIYNGINKGNQDYALSTANALWVAQDYPLLVDYLSSIEKYYGGKAVNLDFASDPEKSRQIINGFIAEQTNAKIKDLLPPDSLSALIRLIITNAIYFKGTWEWQFNPDNTYEDDFSIGPDNIVKTPMMSMWPEKTNFNYADLGDLQILELPYKGAVISMVIILPTEDLAAIEPSLTAEKFQEWKSKMQETDLDTISLPKFEFDTEYTLNESLQALGMGTAFDGEKADFSGITAAERLWIDFVIHRAYIKVDEEGTESAAATGLGIVGVSAPRNVFRADRPFLFLLCEKDTGNILFLGRVVNPTL